MATRKQRRRREKELRHEYVWQDSEGNELDPDDVRSSPNGSTGRTGGGGKPASPGRARGGGARQLQPPSWRRTLKRGLIFAPIFLAVVMLLNQELSLAGAILNTIFLLAVFVPFSYLIDRFMYRSFQRRQDRPARSQTSKRG